MKRAAVILYIVCVLSGYSTAALCSDKGDRDLVLQAIGNLCDQEISTPVVHGATLLDRDFSSLRDGEVVFAGWTVPGDERRLQVSKLLSRGKELTFVDLFRNLTTDMPFLRVVANGRCKVLGGREILYSEFDGKPRPVKILNLNADLYPEGEEDDLNPDPGTGASIECIRIGILDNGVNYLLPGISERVARDSAGDLIGYDFWDDDAQPFDFGVPPFNRDPRISLFRPVRHGTMVASVLLNYAPSSVCIVPVRYPPFSDGNEVADAVQFMKRAGVRIVSVQSARGKPWPAFEAAIRENPDILFVLAAGNEGLDMKEQPFYPTVYDLPNLLVVGGVTADGSLWQRSNTGAGIVDIAVQATEVLVTGFDGQAASLDGTSFAAPKVAAYAARLIHGETPLDGIELHRMIVDTAKLSGEEASGVPILPEKLIRSKP